MKRLPAPVVVSMFCWVCLVVTGCQERPQDGLDALLQASQRKDAEAAWRCFDAPSRAMLRDTAAIMRQEGKLEGSAKTHLLDGFVPQGISSIEVLHKDTREALLLLTDFDGNTQRITMRWEDAHWRLHLPGADPQPSTTLTF